MKPLYKIGTKVKILNEVDEIIEDITGFGTRELIVTIDDIVYSTKKDKWSYKVSWYNDSIDSGNMSFTVSYFHEIVIEVIKE